MFKKRLLIILTLLLSIFLLVSVVSAEEIANDNNDVEIDGLIDSQMPTEDDSLEVIDLENEDNLEINEETSNEEDISSDVSSSKDKLSGSATSDSGNQVFSQMLQQYPYIHLQNVLAILLPDNMSLFSHF